MDKLIRKILTVVLVLAMVGCSRHYYVKEFPVSGKAKVEKAPKIAYLGFRTYQSRVTGSASRRTTYTAELVYETRQNGAPSGLEKRGLDASIYHKTKKPTEGTQ